MKKKDGFRNGDVILEIIKSIPAEAKKVDHLVLKEGEITGHFHEVKRKKVMVKEREPELFEKDGVLYLRVKEDNTPLVHPEHRTIELPVNDYKVAFVQTYDYLEKERRNVAD